MLSGCKNYEFRKVPSSCANFNEGIHISVGECKNFQPRCEKKAGDILINSSGEQLWLLTNVFIKNVNDNSRCVLTGRFVILNGATRGRIDENNIENYRNATNEEIRRLMEL